MHENMIEEIKQDNVNNMYDWRCRTDIISIHIDNCSSDNKIEERFDSSELIIFDTAAVG